MKSPTWITRELLAAIHGRQLAEHGGTDGVRDEAAVANLLEEPKRRFAGGKISITRLAAAYAVWICVSRPFHDRNSQTAAVVCNTFLGLNGIGPVAGDSDFQDAITRIAAGQWAEADFDRWLCGKLQTEIPPTGPEAGRHTIPNRSPIMSHPYQCPRCGGVDAEPGTVQSTGGLHFRPANAKFLTLQTANIEVRANACTNCGHVDLVADVAKLHAITARAQPV
jgi:death-on-curing protein